MTIKHILFTTLFGLLLTVSFGQKPKYKVQTIAFYNLENLFDTIRNEEINDIDFTPQGSYGWDSKKYDNKLQNMSSVIPKIGANVIDEGPAILGVCEIENRGVLEDLVAMPGLKERNYQIVHEDSPDERGIDCALLYQADKFTVESHKSFFTKIRDRGGEPDYTRDVLLVTGLLDGERFHFLVNHWPSRSGGEKVSMPNRIASAELNKEIIDSIKLADPTAKIVTMGDFNDDPVSPSMKKVLNAKGNKKLLQEGDLYNPFFTKYKKGFGTTAWRDAWSLFDQIVVSESLVFPDNGGYQYINAGRHNPDHMLQTKGRFKGYPKRTHAGGEYLNGYSDHFPVYIYVAKEVK